MGNIVGMVDMIRGRSGFKMGGVDLEMGGGTIPHPSPTPWT